MTDGKLIICDNCGMEMDVNDYGIWIYFAPAECSDLCFLCAREQIEGLVAHIEELAKRLKEKP